MRLVLLLKVYSSLFYMMDVNFIFLWIDFRVNVISILKAENIAHNLKLAELQQWEKVIITPLYYPRNTFNSSDSVHRNEDR